MRAEIRARSVHESAALETSGLRAETLRHALLSLGTDKHAKRTRNLRQRSGAGRPAERSTCHAQCGRSCTPGRDAVTNIPKAHDKCATAFVCAAGTQGLQCRAGKPTVVRLQIPPTAGQCAPRSTLFVTQGACKLLAKTAPVGAPAATLRCIANAVDIAVPPRTLCALDLPHAGEYMADRTTESLTTLHNS